MLNKLRMLRYFITRDVENENEVKMYAVVLRVVLLIYAFYCFTSTIFTCAIGHLAAVGVYAVELAVTCLLFYLTYKNMTRNAAYITALMFSFHIVVHSYMYGVHTDLMQFSYVLILLLFAIDYISNMRGKLCILFLIIFVRMIVYYYYSNNEPLYGYSKLTEGFWRISHIVLVSCVVSVIAIITTSDFSKMREKLTLTNRRLRDVAGKDPLTGLSNRRSGEIYINDVIHDYSLGNVPAITLVMADVDLFKSVNDTYGHENGDIVLKDLANIMGAMMRNKGLACRWGGEEFLLVFNGYNGDEVWNILTDMQKEVAELEYHWDNSIRRITLTYGVAEYGLDSSIDEVIKEADDKLYMGKEQGRNRIIF